MRLSLHLAFPGRRPRSARRSSEDPFERPRDLRPGMMAGGNGAGRANVPWGETGARKLTKDRFSGR